MTDRKFFMAVFVVQTPEIHANGRHKHKTISSYVSLFDNFERTINKFMERFVNQDYITKEITVFTSENDFQDEWESIKSDNDIPWQNKNYTLLQRRHDITTESVFCTEGFHPRHYRK